MQVPDDYHGTNAFYQGSIVLPKQLHTLLQYQTRHIPMVATLMAKTRERQGERERGKGEERKRGGIMTEREQKGETKLIRKRQADEEWER